MKFLILLARVTTVAGAASSCLDSEDWLNKGKVGKDCSWVAEDPAERCDKESDGGVAASEACACACRTCADADDWLNKGKVGKDCSWVAEDPAERCDKESDGGVAALEACACACGAEEDDEDALVASGDDAALCEDDAAWSSKKGDCTWVAKNPDSRCSKAGYAIKGKDACQSTCDNGDEEDSESWFFRKASKNCAWIGKQNAKKQKKLCKKAGTDGNACPATCGACPEGEDEGPTEAPTVAPGYCDGNEICDCAHGPDDTYGGGCACGPPGDDGRCCNMGCGTCEELCGDAWGRGGEFYCDVDATFSIVDGVLLADTGGNPDSNGVTTEMCSGVVPGILYVNGREGQLGNTGAFDLGAVTGFTSRVVAVGLAGSDTSGFLGLREVGDSLSIDGCDFADLDGFANLAAVGTHLYIKNNPYLADVGGLDGLTRLGEAQAGGSADVGALGGGNGVGANAADEDPGPGAGSLEIIDNDSLADLNGAFPGVAEIDSLLVKNNAALAAMTGAFPNLVRVGNVQISTNPALATIDGFASVEAVHAPAAVYGANQGHVAIQYNPALTSVGGWNSLAYVNDYLGLVCNAALDAVPGFAALAEVRGDVDILNCDATLDAPTTVAGLGALATIGGSCEVGGDVASQIPGCN